LGISADRSLSFSKTRSAEIRISARPNAFAPEIMASYTYYSPGDYPRRRMLDDAATEQPTRSRNLKNLPLTTAAAPLTRASA
jgi:hypothetical protein